MAAGLFGRLLQLERALHTFFTHGWRPLILIRPSHAFIVLLHYTLTALCCNFSERRRECFHAEQGYIYFPAFET